MLQLATLSSQIYFAVLIWEHPVYLFVDELLYKLMKHLIDSD